MNETLAYYNQNADAFIEGTQTADMSEQYRFFLKNLSPGGKLLDLGCGSGRDSAYFSSLGFEVTAVDGKRIEFKVSAGDEKGLIGEGTHERFIVTNDRFLAKTAKKLEG